MKIPNPEALSDPRRIFCTINQRIQRNCPYQIVFSVEDFEKRGNTQRLTPEAQEGILGAYRAALEVSKESVAEKIALIGGDRVLLQAKRQEIRQYSKEERKSIKLTVQTATRNWEGVQGNKNNPEYNKYFREYEAANDEHNAMIATDVMISSIDDTLGGLSNQQKNLQKEFDELVVEGLCDILSRELEDIFLEEPATIDAPANKKQPKKIGSITKKVGLLVTGIITLGIAATSLKKNNADAKDIPHNHTRMTYSSGNASTDMLSDINNRSILECLVQLEKHGNLKQFPDEVMQELRKNYVTIMHKKAGDTVLTYASIPGSEEYITYSMQREGGRTDFGVTMRDIGLAVSVFLTRRFQELRIADAFRNDAQTARLTAHNTPSTRHALPSQDHAVNIQAQNARLIRDGMIEYTLGDIRKEMIQNGYPIKKIDISDTLLIITYSIAGSDFIFEFPLS